MATSQSNIDPNYLLAALEWQIDQGADEVLGDTPVDKTAPIKVKASPETPSKPSITAQITDINTTAPAMGAAQAIIEAEKLAEQCTTLEALQDVIRKFEGLSIRNNASNMVFADGNKDAKIMVIGDAPRTEDDLEGKAFSGPIGQLQDKILASIGLDRDKVYLTNLLNWRPPGNRSPTQAEMDISLPFLKKHIELIKPNIVISCGAATAKALLGKTENISKLRGTFHDYQGIQIMVTYHPSYLLQTPAQKRATWSDMLMLQKYLKENNG